MNRIARMNAAARADIFAETAARQGLAEAIVEKDFWAHWRLREVTWKVKSAGATPAQCAQNGAGSVAGTAGLPCRSRAWAFR